MLHELLKAVTLLGGCSNHLYSSCLENDFSYDVVRKVSEIGFGNDYKWGRAGIPSGDERTLQAVMGEGPVHRHHDRHDVDVAAQDLFFGGCLESAFAAECRMPRKNLDDGRLTGAVMPQPHPVPGGGNRAMPGIGQMQQAALRRYEDAVPVQPDYPTRSVVAVVPTGNWVGAEEFRRIFGKAVICWAFHAVAVASAAETDFWVA
ncbi:hypothetical protein StoSoilB5_34870 [Arthrobacter sp. StoSoilB5]|nr:hypothetical protein StoSoilB5_34870 [Arthrobacter sp. StoSoilB5]